MRCRTLTCAMLRTREVDHEVLLLWGKEDRWHSANNSVFFQGILQNGRYFLIRNAGHIVQEDTPGKLLEVILSYIPPAAPVYRRRRRPAQPVRQPASAQDEPQQTEAYGETPEQTEGPNA